MVTGGKGGANNSVRTSPELLSINGTRLCALPSLLDKRWHHSQNGLIACGGGRHNEPIQTSCETFTAGSWKKTHTLGHRRFGHAGWSSPQGVLLMGGPRYYSGADKTELLRDNGDIKPSFKLNLKRGE